MMSQSSSHKLVSITYIHISGADSTTEEMWKYENCYFRTDEVEGDNINVQLNCH